MCRYVKAGIGHVQVCEGMYVTCDMCRYVKAYLLPDRSKAGKRKTKVKKHTLNPVFEESLKVGLPQLLTLTFLQKCFQIICI